MNQSFLNEFSKRFLTAIILLFCIGGAYVHSSLLFSLLLTTVLILILLFEWPKLFDRTNKLLFIGVTLLYPILPMLSLIYLNVYYYQKNMLIPLYPFFVAWTYDTCGYLIGKLCGNHKVWPSLSPGKSWEGLFAGFVGVSLFNWFFLPQLDQNLFVNYVTAFFVVITLSLILTLLAFLGGMFISYLKRKNNLKDTGSVLPGHGGFLDRFDSVFFIAIAVLIGVLMHSQ